MPDYVSILNRSIATRQADTPARRQAVYETARAALARQLTAVDPPLSDAEIEAQYQKLEEAVAEVEAAHSPGPGADRDEAAGETEAPVSQEAPHGPVPLPPRRDAPDAMRRDDPDAPRGEPAREPAAPLSADAAPDAMREEEPAWRGAEDVPVDAKPTRAPLYILFLLLGLIVAGAGALAYTQWDTIRTAIGEWRGGTIATIPPKGDLAPSPPPAAAGDAVAGGPSKAEDRLGREDAEAAGEPALGGDETATAALGLEPGAAEAPEAGPAATPLETPDAPADPAGLVGQRAILYEQGEAGAESRVSQGAVSWQRTETAEGQPAIQARVDLPERKVAATITISKNTDQALPASHLIEIAFDEPGNLVGSGIERIPALAVKPSEEARGQGLVGVAVPVTDKLFWIALSAEPAQMQRNLQLLAEGNWFDMPILFKDGKRALITFEKGVPGDQLFGTVMAGWQQ